MEYENFQSGSSQRPTRVSMAAVEIFRRSVSKHRFFFFATFREHCFFSSQRLGKNYQRNLLVRTYIRRPHFTGPSVFSYSHQSFAKNSTYRAVCEICEFFCLLKKKFNCNINIDKLTEDIHHPRSDTLPSLNDVCWRKTCLKIPSILMYPIVSVVPVRASA